MTGSAFSQRRYKIKSDFFKDLSKITLDYYLCTAKRKWKGHILLAGDGSTLNLPASKQVRNDFGVYRKNPNTSDRCISSVFLIHDVLNNYILDAQIDDISIGEKSLLNKGLEACKAIKGLYLLDRNFGFLSCIKQLSSNQQHFCIRLSTNVTGFAKEVMRDHRTDFICEWKPSRKELRTCLEHQLDQMPIKVRVTKVVLNTGETELLVTSLLNQDQYSSVEIAELYHLRWGVEECFKNLKPKMKIEQFGCKKTQGILQEFYAHIFMINMIGLIARPAQEIIDKQSAKTKLTYKYNWKNAYRFFRSQVVAFLSKLTPDNMILEKLILQISRSKVPIKPGRSFIRDPRLKIRSHAITCYYL